MGSQQGQLAKEGGPCTHQAEPRGTAGGDMDRNRDSRWDETPFPPSAVFQHPGSAVPLQSCHESPLFLKEQTEEAGLGGSFGISGQPGLASRKFCCPSLSLPSQGAQEGVSSEDGLQLK